MATDQGDHAGVRGAGMRAVIDAIEGEWARLALDDGQRLDWPVDRLAPGAGQGMAVVLSMAEQDAAGAQAVAGAWAGVLRGPAPEEPAPQGLWARIRRALGLGDGGQERAARAADVLGTDSKGTDEVWVEFGAQRLAWSDPGEHAAGGPVIVCMRVDAGDTAQRQQHVQDLVDDLFG